MRRSLRPRSPVAALLAVVAACHVAAPAAEPPSVAVIPPVSAAERAALVGEIGEVLTALYVDEATARRAASSLAASLARGDLDRHVDPVSLATALTAELRRLTGDRHVEVRLRPAAPATRTVPAVDWREDLRRRGHDFRAVERLGGGIGYLDLRSFPPLEVARGTADAAMTLLAGYDAVVIDLRRNRGGTGEMVELLASWFLPPGTHLSTAHKRSRGEARAVRTRADVPATRLREAPLYLLTSSATFSAAESFAYELQARRRAVVVGETTGGGANAGGWEDVGERFQLFCPDVRVVNAATGGNWEGSGVRPDVAAEAGAALTRAHRAALERLRAGAADSVRRRELEWAAAALDAAGATVAVRSLVEYAGAYGEREVAAADGSLRMRRYGGLWSRLLPAGGDLFFVDGIDGVQLRFERAASGAVAAMRLVYADGDEEKVVRTPAAAGDGSPPRSRGSAASTRSLVSPSNGAAATRASRSTG